MKITVEFANLDEFKQYMGIESPSQLVQAPKEVADAPAPAPAEAVQEPQEAPEAPTPKKNTKKTDKPAPAAAEPVPEPAEAAADDAPAAVTEDFRIVVRKQLAALNKKCGYGWPQHCRHNRESLYGARARMASERNRKNKMSC